MKIRSRTKFIGKHEWNTAKEKEAEDCLHIGRRV